MGASDFFISPQGSFTSAKDAFEYARSEAKYEYGHSGYTGTIAEKHSFVMMKNEPFDSFDDAVDFANQAMNNDDKRIVGKWGPAGCVSFFHNGIKRYLFFGWASS